MNYCGFGVAFAIMTGVSVIWTLGNMPPTVIKIVNSHL